MTSLMQKIHARKNDESGAAMIVAVLILLIMVSLITFMTAFAMRSIEKGNSVQTLNASLNAADTAIANMMTLANSGQNANATELKRHIGLENAVYGSFQANAIDPKTGDGQYSWRWYAESRVDSSTGTSYDIYATGYKTSPEEADARTIKVNISSTTTEGVSYTTDGKVTYNATLGGSFAFAALGMQSVELGINGKVYTYNSAQNIGYPTLTTNRGQVATNGNVIMGTNSAANMGFLGRSAQDTAAGTLCTGTPCATMHADTYQYSMSLVQSRKEALAACPSTGYPDWIASQNAGKISFSGATKCYSNIVFDVDTTIPGGWTTGNPVTMYAKGNITVKPGVEVARQVQGTQGPYALHILASGSTNFTMERGTTANPTKFTGSVVGQGLYCDIGGSSALTTLHGTAFYGSMACNSIKIQRDSTVWWDTQLSKVLKEGSATAKRIWATTSYEEI